MIKGFYDTHKSEISFLITGSARLDYYRKGGDSLQGRYHYYRLHPFSLNELASTPGKKDMTDLLDWSQIQTEGERFENLVACQLLKYCHFIEDTEGYKMELRFLRDTDKREIDFIVLKEKKPVFAVECKTGERKVNPWIDYFRDRTDICEFYQVHPGEKDFGNAHTSVRVLPFSTFCREMNMP
ncbi:MAG: DUF4143 domain-containing protein [Spirochaetales bacterium]|nr:DUF4143 domain-containing protein [Spirochaetales bacterium]